MNGFEKHNIDHLSASSINLWSNAPDVWVMQYLHGLRTQLGQPRGVASASRTRWLPRCKADQNKTRSRWRWRNSTSGS